MSDTFMTVTAVMILVVLMLVVPLVAMATQNDEITETEVQAIVSDFVNDAANEGKISRNAYDKLVQELSATGNSYDISLEVQVFDTNPLNKKGDVIGENAYYSIFNNDIDAALNSEGEYELKQGDRVIAKVVNSNVTLGTQVKNFLFSIMGKDTIAIEVSSSALVSATQSR